MASRDERDSGFGCVVELADGGRVAIEEDGDSVLLVIEPESGDATMMLRLSRGVAAYLAGRLAGASGVRFR